jgi:PKD repeat protein
VANAGGSYTGPEDVAITFDGSGSDDSDGDPLTYAWNFGDGSTGTSENPTHAYTAGGTYTVTLVVNDGKEDSEPSTTTADITEVNDPPVAEAGSDQNVVVDEVVTFEGSGSYDIDGTITVYSWVFGDGNSGTGSTTTHTYETAGEYTVELTVTDNDESTGTTEVPAYTMHIDRIDMSTDSKTRGRNTFDWAVATITIFDKSGNPVEGATVSGYWSGATSDIDSGVTDGVGLVSLESNSVKNPSGGTEFTFTVDNVAKNDWTYDSSANEETSASTTV